MDKITVYGAGGFIGKWFASTFPDEVIVQPRNKLIPATPRILYLISTVDNYSVMDGNFFLDIETNLTHLMRVLESARETFSGKFDITFGSSWFCYGDTNCPAREDSCCNPKGFYSVTKRAAEQLLTSYCETFEIDYRILRFANVLGVGDNKASLRKNALQFITKELVQGRHVRTYNEGSIRDFIDVRDLVQAIHLLMEYGNYGEVYNVGCGVGYNVKDLIDYVVKKTHSEEYRLFMDVPEFHKIVQVREMWLDTTKLYNLGFRSKYTILDTIDWLIDHYKNG